MGGRVRVGFRLRMSERWRRMRRQMGMDANVRKKPEEVFGSAALQPPPKVQESNGSMLSVASDDNSVLKTKPEASQAGPSKVEIPPPLKSLRGTRNECKALDARINKRGDVVLEPSSKPFDLQNTAVFEEITTLLDEYALIVTRQFSKENVLTSTSLKIQSPYVVKALRSIVKYYPDNPVDVSDDITVGDPPALLYHYRKELQQYAENADVSDDAKLHIGYVLAYLRVQLGSTMDNLEKYLAKNLIRYSWVWMIFRPGDLVYSPSLDQLYYFQRGEYDESTNSYVLHCQFVTYDGKDVGKQNHDIYIPAFSEPRELSTLAAIPLKLHSDPEGLKKRLAIRGLRFLELRGIHPLQHSSYGRVMIDRQMYKMRVNRDTENPSSPPRSELSGKCNCICAVCGKLASATMVDYDHELRALAYEDLILCSSKVYGFLLKDHRWSSFMIDDLTDIEWTDKAIEGLVMDQKQKNVILSLTNSRIFMEGQSSDIIGWKGKGLVVLMHGDPGTGKTLTAEVVCEHLERPLYIVNGGELGATPKAVESNLKDLLELSTRWNAIILIDEADVFLEQRSGADIKRNSLVSVFLRQLEYFTGMLFLTTNRVNAFDPAFISRIHLALHYPGFTADQRREIWVRALKRFPAEDIDIDYYGKDLRQLSEFNVNGRAISYAVRTAMALAEAKGEKLTVATLSDVVVVYTRFNDAVNQGKG